jgi:hypothetical protein
VSLDVAIVATTVKSWGSAGRASAGGRRGATRVACLGAVVATFLATTVRRLRTGLLDGEDGGLTTGLMDIHKGLRLHNKLGEGGCIFRETAECHLDFVWKLLVGKGNYTPLQRILASLSGGALELEDELGERLAFREG